MKKTPRIATICAVVLLITSGCAVIAGKEDSGPGQSVLTLKLNFVETLRNQASLRGEAFRDVAFATDPATTLQRPGSVYADRFRVYVTDLYLKAPDIPSARIFVFDRGDRTATILNVPVPPPVSSEGRLLAPAGIAVDGVGIIFVSDSPQSSVFGYDRNGKLLWALGRGSVLASKSGLGELVAPSGLAIDNVRNRLYVADTNAQQVKVFSNMGIHLFDIGKSGKAPEDFKFPVSVALDRAANVYVLDSLRLRVYVFRMDGVFLRKFSLKSATQPGMSIKPKSIAVDSDGHVYVVDAVNNNILIFNNDGTFANAWGRTGNLIGDFLTPAGIFIDDRDYIYIADQTNGRVQVFQYLK